MKAKELLTDKSKWTKYEWARDSEDKHCISTSERACKWCLLGALNVCYENTNERLEAELRLLKSIAKLFPDYGIPRSIALFNDHIETTFEDIQAVLENADV